MDKIQIKNLEIFANHGVFPEENKLGQKFVISATLYTSTRQAGKTDDLTASIHYGEVSQFITKFVQDHTWKLEELAVKLNSTFDVTERNQIAIEMQQQLLDDDAFVFCSFLKMSMISQANVTGLTAHACDYYELTADLDIN